MNWKILLNIRAIKSPFKGLLDLTLMHIFDFVSIISSKYIVTLTMNEKA